MSYFCQKILSTYSPGVSVIKGIEAGWDRDLKAGCRRKLPAGRNKEEPLCLFRTLMKRLSQGDWGEGRWCLLKIGMMKGARERLYKNSRDMQKHMKGILNDGSQKKEITQGGGVFSGDVVWML